MDLHLKEVEAAVRVHKSEWPDSVNMPLAFNKIGSNIYLSISAVRYLYDGKYWKKISS
jgi:hypothetical protein